MHRYGAYRLLVVGQSAHRLAGREVPQTDGRVVGPGDYLERDVRGNYFAKVDVKVVRSRTFFKYKKVKL